MITANTNVIFIACGAGVIVTIICVSAVVIICLMCWRIKTKNAVVSTETFQMTENAVYVYMQAINMKKNSAYDYITVNNN